MFNDYGDENEFDYQEGEELRDEFAASERVTNKEEASAAYMNLGLKLKQLYYVLYHRKNGIFSEYFPILLEVVMSVLKKKDIISIEPTERNIQELMSNLINFGNEQTLNPVLYIISYVMYKKRLKKQTEEQMVDEFRKLFAKQKEMPYPQIDMIGVVRYYRRWISSDRS